MMGGFSVKKRKEYLFVDGYNMIGSWPELVALKKQDDIQGARDLLLFELSNYKKYRRASIIVVFDAHFVPGLGTSFEHELLEVVFTNEGETADAYIESQVSKYMNPLTRVVVATSDAAEQWLIFQKGALRQSAQELWMDIQFAKQQMNQDVSRYYDKMLRRLSPWRMDELERLEQLRKYLDQ